MPSILGISIAIQSQQSAGPVDTSSRILTEDNNSLVTEDNINLIIE
jgi:hypothetical protein